MTRVLLINPLSPERLGAPLLGFQQVAAAFLSRDCEVRVIDAGARNFTRNPGAILAEALDFSPEIVGFSLSTRWAGHAYRLAGHFIDRFPLLVAGGPHPTARPVEVLRHGFDIAVIGEAEETISQLVEHVRGRKSREEICGIWFRASGGIIGEGRPPIPPEDLDLIPLPHIAQSLFDPRWYHDSELEALPGGIITSRGCPARCTFCANSILPRSFRYRSPQSIVEELKILHARSGATFFPFWDDAFTSNRERLFPLLDAFERQIPFELRWSAITRANMISQKLLAAMKRAGCIHINFGVESGDDETLRTVKKGLTTAEVVRALESANALGLTVTCNFMLGFPHETPEAIERTLLFMERIAPLVNSFGTLGVVVPFPGTPLYEESHRKYGFTDWWLREEYSRYLPPPPIEEPERFYRYYIDDPNLELNFFRYPEGTRQIIRACLKFKADHNLRRMGYGRLLHPGRPALFLQGPPQPHLP